MATMYQGWMMLGGEELWNAERTRAYVTANLPSIELMGCEECSTLATALGDAPYKNNPTDDNAPWISAEDPDLALFYGFYPLEISGMTDSSATVTVTESIGDGGTVSAVRRATKEIRVSGLLMAGSQIALNRGKAWIRNITQGPACQSGTGCGGADLCFFAACPATYTQGNEYLRIVRDVSLVQGVTTTREFSPAGGGCTESPVTPPDPGGYGYGSGPYGLTSYGGSGTTRAVDPETPLPTAAYMEQVEFTFVAATPWVYSSTRTIGSTLGTVPTTTGYITLDPTAPLLPDCNSPLGGAQIVDPTLPVVPSAPRPPPVQTNLKPTQPWASGYSVFVPKAQVPETVNAVLVISLTTGSEAARYIRLRLFPAPLGFEQKVSDLDPCSYCGEIVVMYIPPRSTFRIDGMNQTLTIIDAAGNVFPASHLAYSGVGLPTGWASMTCGLDYWISVEFPGEADPSNKFITGTAKDSSTFDVDLGNWQNGPNEDGSARATLVRDTGAGNYHTGPGGMRVSWPQGSTDRPQILLSGLTPGLTYELGVWMKTPTVPIRLDMGPGMSGTQSVVSAAWQYVTVNATATATQHMVRIANTTTTASGNCYFDEFVLRDNTTARYSVARLDLATARRM